MDNGQSGDTSSSPEVPSGHRPTPDVSLALCPSYSLLAWVAGQSGPGCYTGGFTWVRFGCIGQGKGKPAAGEPDNGRTGHTDPAAEPNPAS